MKNSLSIFAATVLISLTWTSIATAKEKAPAFLGISVSNVSPALQTQLDLKPKQGVVVEWVQPKSPADKGGLKQYDVLMEFNGKSIATEKDLANAVSEANPSDQVSCWIIRKTKHDALKITLSSRPKKADTPKNGKNLRIQNGNLHQTFGDGKFALELNFPPVIHDGATSFILHDGTHLTQARRNAKGELELTIRANNGKLIYKGPANTPADHDKIPEAIRERLKASKLLR